MAREGGKSSARMIAEEKGQPAYASPQAEKGKPAPFDVQESLLQDSLLGQPAENPPEKKPQEETQKDQPTQLSLF